MPRRPRVKCEEALDHVISQGIHRWARQAPPPEHILRLLGQSGTDSSEPPLNVLPDAGSSRTWLIKPGHTRNEIF